MEKQTENKKDIKIRESITLEKALQLYKKYEKAMKILEDK